MFGQSLIPDRVLVTNRRKTTRYHFDCVDLDEKSAEEISELLFFCTSCSIS